MTVERWSQWHPLVQLAVGWFERQPVVGALLVLMLLDILMGLIVAVGTRTVSSSTSWRGMSKKATVLLILGVAAVIEPYAQGLPLTKLVALFYVVTETLSILENAAAVGVPLPPVLTDALAKLHAAKPPPASNATVTVQAEVTVSPTTEAPRS